MLRVASYNIRVDHTDDIGTINEWMNRRRMREGGDWITSDLVLVQEHVRTLSTIHSYTHSSPLSLVTYLIFHIVT